jgi:cytochrome c
MKFSALIAASALLALAPTVHASEELAEKNSCLGCHAVDEHKVGPSFQEVAAKYKGQKDAAAKLADKVKKGGKGVWGTVPMPPNTKVSDKDLKQLIAWILSQK